MDAKVEYVWYVSYGSNLLLERFLVYILGGTAPGGKRANPGCTDSTLPLQDKAFEIQAGLYFSGISRIYDGGVAFIDPSQKTSRIKARGYLVTLEQFWEITAQENAWDDMPADLPTLADIKRRRTHRFKRTVAPSQRMICKYSRVVHLGDHEGYPMLSFTTPRIHTKHRRPSPLYLQTIAHGLRQSHQLTTPQIAEYLANANGAKGEYTLSELIEIVEKRPLGERFSTAPNIVLT